MYIDYMIMEKHIFKFGSGSLAIILPKKWADKSGIDEKRILEVTEDMHGNLVLSASAAKTRSIERTIGKDMSGTLVGRWIGMHYIYGFSKIRLYSKEGFTRGQLDGAEEKIAECPGFEITVESSNDMVIEDFTNIKDIDIEKVMGRLRSLINEEFVEILGGDSKTISKIERLVNRFYMLGVRYLNITQAQNALKYFDALQQLEYISDRLDIVSSSLQSRGKEIMEDISMQFGLCIDGFHGDVGSIAKAAELRGEIQSKIGKFKGDRLEKYLMSQLSNSTSTIAELGLREEEKE